MINLTATTAEVRATLTDFFGEGCHRITGADNHIEVWTQVDGHMRWVAYGYLGDAATYNKLGLLRPGE